MRISRFLRRTYNICRGIVGIHEYSRITLTFVRLICSSILSNGKKRKMASNRNRRDGRRRTGTRDSVDWPGKWCRVASGKRRVIRSRRVGMSPSCVPAAGRHQRQPRLAARGDRGVVNLHRCLSIIASSLSPVRPLLLQFLFQSPSSINSDNARSSLTKIFILLVSPRRISYVTRIYIYIQAPNNYNYHNPNNVSTSLFPATSPIRPGILKLATSHLPSICPTIYSTCAHVVIISSPFPRCSFNVTSHGHFHYAQPFINSVALAYVHIYIYILHTQRKGSPPPPRSPAISREIISLEITTLGREKGGGRIYKEKDRFRRKRKKILGEERPAVSRDNWDTVYYRLRAIVAVCDWIGGDGSREIADPN